MVQRCTAPCVPSNATHEEIKQAYRSLALRYHPDKVKQDSVVEATRRFQDLQAAFEAVSPANRARYDAGISRLSVGQTDLMLACQAGDVDRVRRLVEDLTEVNARDSTGRTALHYAASAASVEILRVLIKHRADVEERNCAGHSCLMFAVGAGLQVQSAAGVERALRHWEAVKYLLDEGAPVNAATGYGLTALMLACTSGRMNMIDLLLSRGADPTATTDIGLTPLVMAADRGNVAAVRRVLAAAADVNSRHADGRTPLMSAAAQAHTAVVVVLLAARADMNATTADNQSPLLFAVAKEVKDGLVCPIAGDHVMKPEAHETVDALLCALADPNRPAGGQSPLHVACSNGSVDLAERLLAAGARPDVVDAEGKNPADVAVEKGHREVVFLLNVSPPGASHKQEHPMVNKEQMRDNFSVSDCFSLVWYVMQRSLCCATQSTKS